MKVFKKTISNKNIYKEYVSILNGLLKLSGKEMEVLSLLLEIEFTKPTVLGRKQDLLSTDNRKALMNRIGINKNNLSKYLSILKDKRVLLNDESGYYVNGMYMPNINDKVSETVFILNLKEND